MLKNNNLSNTSQNHSSLVILKNFVYRWFIDGLYKFNITAEFELPSMIHSYTASDIQRYTASYYQP